MNTLYETLKQETIIVYDLEVDQAFSDWERWSFPTFEKARLIQIWGCKIQWGEIIEVFEEYILPEPWYQVSQKVTNITWITSDDIRMWIDEKEWIEKFLEFIWEDRDSVILAWHNNIWFDNQIFKYVVNKIEQDPFIDYELPVRNFDVLQIARRLFWRWWNNNMVLSETLWVNHWKVKSFLTEKTWKDYSNVQAHTALYDSIITAKNMLILMEKHPEYFI